MIETVKEETNRTVYVRCGIRRVAHWPRRTPRANMARGFETYDDKISEPMLSDAKSVDLRASIV